MDSFYDQPRKAPPRKTFSEYPENGLHSLIPEVSMLQQNKGKIVQKRNEMSYNAWKHHLRGMPAVKSSSGKENRHLQPPRPLYSTDNHNSLSNGSLFRKQVRFESPQLNHQPTPVVKAPNMPLNLPRSAITKHKMDCQPLNLPKPEKRHILPEKPFEQMYMANVPNRNLDISLIDLPRPGFRQILPQKPPIPQIPFPAMREVMKTQETNSSNEPTVKDLLKIIQQQNEQMLVLQQQVSSLLKDRSQQQMLEAPINLAPTPILPLGMPPRSSNVPNKIAIDVMTSFEVSIRPPNHRFQSDDPRIIELSESNVDSQVGKNNEVTLKLDEPLVVHERCPSPVESIHVDMQAYSSDDDDDEEKSNMDVSSIGWTIYNNVMDQLNYMIKKSTANVEEDFSSLQPNTQLSNEQLQHVKEVTRRHLKNAGINLNRNLDDLQLNNDSNLYSSKDVSFAVKQLLMKYLPDEKLANIGARQQSKTVNRFENYPKNAFHRRPEFSMATMQYMEKYNLLNHSHTKNTMRQGGMLDITALKQQPKLL